MSSVTLDWYQTWCRHKTQTGSRRCSFSSERLSVTTETLKRLLESTRVGLSYSPSYNRGTVYPAIIYEAKSESIPFLWSGNQVATAASRALELLIDLPRLCDWATVSSVFALTLASSLWQAHITFTAINGNAVDSIASQPYANMSPYLSRETMVYSRLPLLSKKHFLEGMSERFFQHLILRRMQK